MFKLAAHLRTIIALVTLLAATSALASAPAVLPVRGAMTTVGGGPVASGKYTLTVRLYAAKDAKSAAYKEIHVAVPISQGGFSVRVGATEPAKNPLPIALFTTGKAWLGVQVDADPELPRVHLASTAFALHATSSQLAEGLSKLITGKQIAPGTINASHAGFTFAGSKTKGGPADKALAADSATNATNAQNAQVAENAKTAEQAKHALKADEATNAAWAGGLKCTGCVAVANLSKTIGADLVTAKQLHKVALSGKFADLSGGPDLSGVGLLNKANTWTEPQGFAKGLSIGADSNFNRFQAKLMRVHNNAGAPAKCDAKMVGGLYFDTKTKRFYGCDGSAWQAFTASQNDQASPAASCLELLGNGKTKDGLYWVAGVGGQSRQVWCDQTRAGGGWMLTLHVFSHTGMSNNKFIAATGHHNFTDAFWQLKDAKIITGAQAASPQPGKVTGALDIAMFKGKFDDLRMSCSKNSGDLNEQAYGVIKGFATTNGNHKLLGAAANGKSYTVDKGLNSSGNTTIWVDNETDGINSGHYTCDTATKGSNGTSQFSLCYTDFLNNNNSKDHGDSIVAIAFGHVKGDDSWSKGFSGECGNMGTAFLADKGTFSIYVR